MVGGRTPLTGAEIANLNPALAEETSMPLGAGGVGITRLQHVSVAARLGFRPDGHIDVINGRKIDSVATAMNLLNAQQGGWRGGSSATASGWRCRWTADERRPVPCGETGARRQAATATALVARLRPAAEPRYPRPGPRARGGGSIRAADRPGAGAVADPLGNDGQPRRLVPDGGGGRVDRPEIFGEPGAAGLPRGWHPRRLQYLFEFFADAAFLFECGDFGRAMFYVLSLVLGGLFAVLYLVRQVLM